MHLLVDLNKDMFLKVPNETCSSISCLLGYISWGVHLWNNMLMFKGKNEHGPVYHATLSESMLTMIFPRLGDMQARIAREWTSINRMLARSKME